MIPLKRLDTLETQLLDRRLRNVINEFRDHGVTYAAVIGVLQIIQHDLYQEARED